MCTHAHEHVLQLALCGGGIVWVLRFDLHICVALSAAMCVCVVT